MNFRLSHKIILATTASLVIFLILTAYIILQSFRTQYTDALITGAYGIGYSIESVLNEMLSLGLPIESLSGMNDKLSETISNNPNIGYIGITDL
jgi:uncharacterized membrane protein (DUF485 family)